MVGIFQLSEYFIWNVNISIFQRLEYFKVVIFKVAGCAIKPNI